MSDSNRKSGLRKAVDWYLNDPVSLAISAAFTCGMVGFLIGSMCAFAFAAGHLSAALIGSATGFLCAVWGARDQLRSVRRRADKAKAAPTGDHLQKSHSAVEKNGRCSCSDATSMRWMALFAGASMITGAVLDGFGVSRNLLLVLSLLDGALIATMLAMVLDRDRS